MVRISATQQCPNSDSRSHSLVEPLRAGLDILQLDHAVFDPHRVWRFAECFRRSFPCASWRKQAGKQASQRARGQTYTQAYEQTSGQSKTREQRGKQINIVCVNEEKGNTGIRFNEPGPNFAIRHRV